MEGMFTNIVKLACPVQAGHLVIGAFGCYWIVETILLDQLESLMTDSDCM